MLWHFLICNEEESAGYPELVVPAKTYKNF
jgi:hypothetical protein